MVIILYAVFWLIGLVITSFTLIPVLIIIFFSIPATRKLEKLQVLKANNGIFKMNLASLIILTVVFLATVIITIAVYPNGLVGLLFGGGMVLLFGIGKIGANEDNISDYFEVNKRDLLTTMDETRYLITGKN